MQIAQNTSFPQKLFLLLETESPEFIRWLHHGLAFKVIDPERFAQEILPKYFRHTKLSSFQRQLNLYGFRKITKGHDIGATFHPSFQRDKRELMSEIRRVAVKSLALLGETPVSLDKEAELSYTSDDSCSVNVPPKKRPSTILVEKASSQQQPFTMSKLSMNLGFGKSTKQAKLIQKAFGTKNSSRSEFYEHQNDHRLSKKSSASSSQLKAKCESLDEKKMKVEDCCKGTTMKSNKTSIDDFRIFLDNASSMFDVEDDIEDSVLIHRTSFTSSGATNKMFQTVTSMDDLRELLLDEESEINFLMEDNNTEAPALTRHTSLCSTTSIDADKCFDDYF